MLSRRNCLKQIATSALSLQSLAAISKITSNELSAAKGEEYWKMVRQLFPLDSDWVYLNAATLGPSPYTVVDTLARYTRQMNTLCKNPPIEGARKAIAAMVNADVSEIALTHNTTEGINIIAQGIPLKRGDEVIMTTHEHAGNALPWLNRRNMTGIRIRTFVPKNTAAENLQAINDLISRKTRVIAVPHISCTTGLVLPAAEIATLAKDKGIWSMIDGAHIPGSTLLNIEEIGCDFYASCCHKWMMGPKGTGFLFVKKELQHVVKPIWIGALSDKGWNLEKSPPTFDGYLESAARYDFGTHNGALWKGVEATVAFLSQIGLNRIEERTRKLTTYLFVQLNQFGKHIEMLSPTEASSRGPIVGFRVKNMDYKAFWQALYERKYRIRMVPEAGLFSQRVSTHIYNSIDEMNELVSVIKDVLKIN